MNLDIVFNKYLLMWFMLYNDSFSQDVDVLRKKIYNTHRIEYSLLQKDKIDIHLDIDNYIPDDDILYNLIEESSLYQKLQQETKQYKMKLLQLRDKKLRNYTKELKDITRYLPKDTYKICAIHPMIDVLETDFKHHIITVGKYIDSTEEDNFLTYLVYKIFRNEFSRIKTTYPEILQAILELAITNELYTRVTSSSKYNLGKKSLKNIKEKIYPYWLMYLGYDPKDFKKYMDRDNIKFNTENYTYIKQLKNMDIFGFIEYIIEQRSEIFNKKVGVIEEIEVL